MRVWERGAGATLACGTGACAVVVAAVLEGHSERSCTVDLPGGPLEIEWKEEDNHIYMTGPAEVPISLFFKFGVFKVTYIMTFEASLVGKKNKETITQTNRVIRKKKCRIRTKHHLPKVPISLQKLFLACKDVFKGPGTVPPPQDVQKLEHILDNMKPEDVGLSSELLFFKPRSVIKGTPSVTCTTIYQCKNFSLCLFFLSPTAVIPLHNHPEMTVFSKLLLGSMHIKSFDWVDSNTCDDSTRMRLARMKVNNVFTAPCNTSVLYPTSGGNIHAFTAVTACAVLDVIGPPYSKDDGRDCSYYKESPYSNSLNGATTKAGGNDDDDASYGWLEEIQVPKDLRMARIEYLGPQIVETSC